MAVAYLPLRGRPAYLVILTTITLGIVLENLALIIWGSLPESVPSPVEGRPWRVAGAIVTRHQAFTLATTGILLLALSLFLTRTRFGVLMQATSQDLTMARLVGIRVNRTLAVAFALGSALAGVAGLLVAPLFLAEPTMGGTLGLKGFVVSVLGGFGSLPGAVLGRPGAWFDRDVRHALRQLGLPGRPRVPDPDCHPVRASAGLVWREGRGAGLGATPGRCCSIWLYRCPCCSAPDTRCKWRTSHC